MFKNKTLFILGAGASHPFGYPLGRQLIKDIIKDIKTDSVYVPMSPEKIRQFQLNTYSTSIIKFKLDDFISELKIIIQSDFNKDGQQALVNLISFKGKTYAKIPLRQIEELINLMSALEQFDPVSIDSFLNNHKSHSLAGKIMIVYTLLKCEDKSEFELYAKSNDNWYSYLIGDILSGCNEAKDILGNNLDFISFNYDLSLDYCLLKKLSNVEILKDDRDAQGYINQLVTQKIKHVYGKLYDDKLIDRYSMYQSTPSNQTTSMQTERFLKAIESRDLIKLINEERLSGDTEVYASLIKEAEKVIIIGFGFDRDNLNILGFPSQLSDYANVLHSKKILYMDYEGKMKSLSAQFEELNIRCNAYVTRSVSTSIIDAYQNDFKIYLY